MAKLILACVLSLAFVSASSLAPSLGSGDQVALSNLALVESDPSVGIPDGCSGCQPSIKKLLVPGHQCLDVDLLMFEQGEPGDCAIVEGTCQQDGNGCQISYTIIYAASNPLPQCCTSLFNRVKSTSCLELPPPLATPCTTTDFPLSPDLFISGSQQIPCGATGSLELQFGDLNDPVSGCPLETFFEYEVECKPCG